MSIKEEIIKEVIMKYRKKPVVIEAIKWTGQNLDEIIDFCEGKATYEGMVSGGGSIVIDTLEGRMSGSVGDYIIKEPFDKKRGFYPCKPNIFEKTYEKVLVNNKWKEQYPDYYDENLETVICSKCHIPVQEDTIFVTGGEKHEANKPYCISCEKKQTRTLR
jgi:hypothetical protein